MPNKGTAKTALGRNGLVLPSLITIVILFFLAIVGLWVSSILVENARVVTIGRESFTVEVADTQAEREKGLGQRDSLGENNAMLFEFETEDYWTMTMLNMRFPLDMAWLDENGKIVHLRTDLTADTFPNVFRPDAKSWYVLEVNAGTFERLGVKVGDSVRL
jgi:uncharacterized protein